MMILILILAIAIPLLWYVLWRPYNFWKRRGIVYKTPIPIFGNNLKSSLSIDNFCNELMDVYNAYPTHKCVGMYFSFSPHLLIRDPELIKAIAIKQFDHFMDHVQVFFREDLDYLFTKNLFVLRGQKWRSMRATLSPAFTGSKMKIMLELISECGAQLQEYLLENYNKRQDQGPLEIELRDLITRYANDVIATAAFGIKCDSLKQKDNDFYLMSQDATNFAAWRFILVSIVPFIMKIFNQGLLPKRVYTYFSQLVGDTLSFRRKENIVRPDMIHLLLEAQKGTLKGESADNQSEKDDNVTDKATEVLTDTDIIAQAFIFLLAGFESTSAEICFMGHELAVNPDVQKRLQDEIDDILDETNGKITYECLQKMKYMDMVFAETLRKWPTAPNTDRVCNKPFTITEHDGSVINVEMDMNIVIPVYPLHHDPKYFPNPEKFDPERFSDENKDKITPYTYLPFGLGPRNCIGSRFAIMEAKIIFVYILSKFDIVVTKKTDIPLQLLPTASKVTAKKWIPCRLSKKKDPCKRGTNCWPVIFSTKFLISPLMMLLFYAVNLISSGTRIDCVE